MKIRIGKSFDKETNEVFYQLQFKLNGERTYNAYSYDVFKEESDAKEALNKHLSGEREYTYFVSAEKVKRTIKENTRETRKERMEIKPYIKPLSSLAEIKNTQDTAYIYLTTISTEDMENELQRLISNT
jgi:vacuolar-type H+-ATPase subunit F/Vma7